MTHGRADGLFIISGTIASTLFLFHLGGSPVTCYLSLQTSWCHLHLKELNRLCRMCLHSLLCVRSSPVLSNRTHLFFFFLIVLGLGRWWGQPMICSNCFKFWSCLHYKCLCLCCSDPATFLRVWAWLAWLRQQTQLLHSARPSFTGLSVA